MIDAYSDWIKNESIPIIEEFCVDLNTVETKFWPRVGVNAAAIHMQGRGDFVSVFLLDIPAGSKTEPQRHLYEEIFYVISGTGTTQIELADGTKHIFEWGPRSMFAPPLNAKYRLFNSSGTENARVASTNNFPMMIKAFRNESFIFNNNFNFVERYGTTDFFEGKGAIAPNIGSRKIWETNFVPDLSELELISWAERGTKSSHISFSLAEGTVHAHCSQMLSGTYKKAHRHGPDAHVFIVTGEGYSLFWDKDKEYKRYDWKPGCLFAPTDMIWHQHFNTSSQPVRYMATAYGSSRYPFFESKIIARKNNDKDVKKGGQQIEYYDQDPYIHELFLKELEKKKVKSQIDISLFVTNKL